MRIICAWPDANSLPHFQQPEFNEKEKIKSGETI
jgi:hypothetical protein